MNRPTVRALAPLLAVTAALVLVAGCGDDDGGAVDHTLPPAAERVPLTDRAAAAVALTHLPDDPSSTTETFVDRDLPKGIVAVDLRYRNDDAQSDGNLVRVAVHPGPPGEKLCPSYGECAELETDVEGARLYLTWEEEVPEEDPGVVAVRLVRDGESSYILSSGPPITGDPRELDLPVGVDAMVAAIEDPWLTLGTSPEAVAAGEDLDDWTPAPSYSR